MDWRLIQANYDLFEFFKACIEFRRRHTVLRNGYFLRGEDYLKRGAPDVSWHGLKVGKPDWSDNSLVLAMLLNGDYAKGGLALDDHIYIVMNMHWQDQTFDLPPAPGKKRWHMFANTSTGELHWPGTEALLGDQRKLPLKSYAVAILVGK